jgi:biopolymer transport protein TolR
MIEDTGGKRFRRKASTVMTEINVTPFVDVMLVLLIIFMVTTPLMQSGVNVDLPKQDAGFLEISEQNVVTLRRDGSIFFNEKRVSLKDLEIGLRSIAALAPTTEVYLKADRSIKYGSVVGVMGAIKRAGISRLGMVTEVSHTPEKKKRAK